MYGCHYELAKVMTEGRREQVRKSAVQRKKYTKSGKQQRKKGAFLSFMKSI